MEKPVGHATKRASRFPKFLFILTLVYSIALLVAPYLPPDGLIHGLLCYAPPRLLAIPYVPAILVSLYAWMKRRDRLNSSLTIITALATLPFLYSFELNLMSQKSGAANVRVMTSNIFFNSRQVPELAAHIRENEIDVLLLQENKGDENSPAAYLKSALPGYHLFMDGSNAILSRWPLTETQSVTQRSLAHRRILLAKVNAPTPFRVLTMHWSVPQVSKGLSTFRQSIPHQMSDYQQLVELISNEKLPLIFGGDFNNPPRHGLTRRLRSKYKNAFSEVGFGSGMTYSSSSPLVRIDHLYCNDKVSPVTCKVGPSFSSDHRSLIATFNVLP